MPIYEYLCPKCGATSERLVNLGQRAGQVCDVPTKKFSSFGDSCAALLDRQVSVPSPAQFKGSGFYCNDYPK